MTRPATSERMLTPGSRERREAPTAPLAADVAVHRGVTRGRTAGSYGRSALFALGLGTLVVTAATGCGQAFETAQDDGKGGAGGSSSVDTTSSTGTGGASSSSSAGGGGGEKPTTCEDSSDCTNTDKTGCTTPICNSAGKCDVTNAPATQASLIQTLEDCKMVYCDGDGGVESVADVEDVPHDAALNDCQVPACDENGNIISLPDILQVPDDLNLADCQAPGCLPDGTPTSRGDNLQLPNDGIDCTQDNCNDGVPSSTPKAQGADCGNSDVCNGEPLACVDAGPNASNTFTVYTDPGHNTDFKILHAEGGVVQPDSTPDGLSAHDKTQLYSAQINAGQTEFVIAVPAAGNPNYVVSVIDTGAVPMVYRTCLSNAQSTPDQALMAQYLGVGAQPITPIINGSLYTFNGNQGGADCSSIPSKWVTYTVKH